MNQINETKWGALIIMALICYGCQSIGLAPAQNFEQKLAYSYSQNSGTREAAATALENGRLGKQEAQAVLEITNQIRTLLDAARVANGVGDISTAEARLTLAISLLQSLQNRLNGSKP
jgi:uncharacterized protein YkwD